MPVVVSLTLCNSHQALWCPNYLSAISPGKSQSFGERNGQFPELPDARIPYIFEKGEDKIIPPTKPAELKRIKELVCKSPGVRQDMVAGLRTRILGGAYKVRAEQVAEKIMQHGVYMLGTLVGNGHSAI